MPLVASMGYPGVALLRREFAEINDAGQPVSLWPRDGLFRSL
jgi:hypothetical protein